MSTVDSTCQMHRLYEGHHAWLASWLRKRLSCREQAADLAQDTFVKVLLNNKAAELREPRAYLTSVARSLLIDMFRRRSIEQAYQEVLAAQPERVVDSPETREIIIEALMEVDRLLDSLGERGRSIFIMAQIEGLSLAEIARQLKLSVNTVRKHFIRAMAQCLMLLD